MAYLSKLLNETEHNYEIHDKEILVVIRELENLRHLLEGIKFQLKSLDRLKNLGIFHEGIKIRL